MDGFGVMTVMTFQHGLFFLLHFAKGIPHHGAEERHPQLWIYSLRIASLKGSTTSEAMAGSPISGQLDVEQSQGFKS